MTFPDPLTPISISGGIIANLATEILKHYSIRLEDSLAGKILKHTGIIPKNLSDQLNDLLGQTLKTLFERYPEYRVSGFIEFIKNPDFTEQLLSFLFDRKNIDNKLIQNIFLDNFPSDPYTRILLNRRGLEAEQIVQAFFVCYREVLLKNIDAPQALILFEIYKENETVIEEIRASEKNLKEFVEKLFAQNIKPSKEASPISWDYFLARCELKLDAEIKLSVGRKYIPILYISREIENQYDEFVNKSTWERKAIAERIYRIAIDFTRQIDETNQYIKSIKKKHLELDKDEEIITTYLAKTTFSSPEDLWKDLNSLIYYLNQEEKSTIVMKEMIDTLGDELDRFNLKSSEQHIDKVSLNQEWQEKIFRKLLHLSREMSPKLKSDALKKISENKSKYLEEIRNNESHLVEFNEFISIYGQLNDILARSPGQEAKKDIEAILDNLENRLDHLASLLLNPLRIVRTHKTIRKHFHNGFLIVDRAGSGKTNLICHLAKKYSKSQAVVFISGKMQLENEYSLEDYIVRCLRNPEIGQNFNNLEEVSDFLDQSQVGTSGKKLFVFIDGINENPNAHLIRSSIQRTLTKCQCMNIYFCISCRDIFWDYFKDEFWDQFLYVFAKDKLYNFSPSEYSQALEVYFSYYHIDCQLDGDAFDKCKQPLLLRFFCEAYGDENNTNYLHQVNEIRLKKLFDDYWDRKISNTRSSLGFRTNRDIENFLYSISDYMWKNHTGSIPVSDLGAITKVADLDSNRSIYVRILDEDIVIEQSLSRNFEPWVAFVYDEFMEYTIAREILSHIPLNSPDNKAKEYIELLINNSQQFTNIEGVVGYFCIMLATDRKYPVWDVFLEKGLPWTLIISKAINQLTVYDIKTEELVIIEKLSSLDDIIKAQVIQTALKIQGNPQYDLTNIWINLFSSSVTRPEAAEHLILLANQGRQVAITAILDAMQDPSKLLWGIYCVTKIPTVDATSLRKLIRSNDSLTRQMAAWALQYFSDGKPGLFYLLQDKNPDVRREACKSISKFHDLESGLKLLSICDQDQINKNRRTAASAIKKIAKKLENKDKKTLLYELNEIIELEKMESENVEEFYIPNVFDIEEDIGDGYYFKNFDGEQENLLYLNQFVDDDGLIEDEDGPFEILDFFSFDGREKPTSSELVEDKIQKETIYEILSTVLNEVESDFILAKFGSETKFYETYENIGRKYHISEYEVREIEHQAMAKLRHPSIRRKLRDFLS